MSHPCLTACCLTLFTCSTAVGEAWQTRQLHDQFFAEGASAGDIDGDKIVDVVCGPVWFRGPEFEQSFSLAPAREFPIAGYSDQFFSHVLDANRDGANDVLVLGFPGRAARLYVNPGHDSLGQDWPMQEIAETVDNESPTIADIMDGGLPEIVCGRDGQYGYYQAGDDATQPWAWVPITRGDACQGRFAHGLGVGDVNGDGRLDILDKTYWWQQPKRNTTSGFWERHRWAPQDYGPGGSQICVDDIDGDGDADILTAHHAHGFGLSWFEQVQDNRFVQHTIMGESSTDNDYGVAFSQLHAVVLTDIDGDDVKDIVTGKRWMAHHGKDPGGLQEPVLYWFQCVRDRRGVTFIPHLIDRDSGVGVDLLVADINADRRPDIVSCNKRGLSIHLQGENAKAITPTSWKQIEGSDQSTYANGFSPTDAAANTLVADGFTVDLIASEPELTQPIAMCFDARGRIWVVEGHTYPTKAPPGTGQDRIVIFSDEDADGSFETKKTFAEGLNLVSGIEVGFGGVWIGAAPELLFIPDADQDDSPDAEPQILLDGWGYQDTHETLNSFTWGPDGWLYGCQGVFTHSRVGKPGTNDDQRTKMNAGVWRYHPTQHRFEVFAHGTSNPWGLDFNDRGDWFISACVIPHLFHVQKNARYQRQAGPHFDPYTYDDIKTIADHSHYAGSIRDHAYWGDNKTTKSVAPINTSLLGGGHAHCGLAIYNADVFPQEYHGDLFFHNLHGHRLVRETLENNGSGYIGKHRPDFSRAQDHLEIGVGVMVGPDGAIYTSDWHDVQTCHNRDGEVWDRTNGRLFRIRYGDVRPQSFDLWTLSDEQLVDHLKSNNAFLARQARRILQERAATASLNVETVIPRLAEMQSSETPRRIRLRSMWTQWCIGAVDTSDLIGWLKDENEYVRAWAVYFIGEGHPTDAIKIFRDADFNFADSSPVVRRNLASLLQSIPLTDRWPIVSALTSVSIDQHDPNLPFLIWYAVAPLAADDPGRAYSLASESKWQDLLRMTVRRIAVSPSGREMLVATLVDSAERKNRLVILEALNEAATNRGGVTMPATWPEAYPQLIKAPLPRVRQLTRAVAIQFGDESVFPYFRNVFSDREKSKQERVEALTALRAAKDSTLPDQIFSQLDDGEISTEAVRALSEFNDPRTGERLLENFERFSASTQTAALSTLASRTSSAAQLVSAMQQGRVQSDTVPAFIVRQIVMLGDTNLNQQLESVWGRIAASDAEKQTLYTKYRSILRPRAIASADASRGRRLYEANCGKCHKLFGVGGDIGPDITGANRSSVTYWLENILEPNALIGKAYQVATYVTVDGRVITGIIKAENDDAVTLQTVTENVVIPRDEIEASAPATISLMPEGQLQPMSDQQVLDLFKYLMSPAQVSLTDEAPANHRRPSSTPNR
mgnify:CR=1 FL=1|tara:strand:+ start:116421 stop:120620 length:4200 start_codon:yes stop_codon:yes gene_type:complete